MTSLDLAFRLINVFEGCKLTAYWDPTGKVWTIGYGHTKNVKEHDQITLDQAMAFFNEDATPLAELVKNKPLLEAACLISFGYNLGAAPLKLVLANPATYNITHYITSNGQILPGLVSRRNLEAALIEVSKSLSK